MIKNYFRIASIIIMLSTAIQLRAQISGTVFRDFNANGSMDASASYNEIGLSGVTVNAYNNANTLVGTTTTALNGAYSFTGLTLPLRIEFSGFATGDFAGAAGSNNSSVQFYSVASTSANFGVNYPSDYTQTNPLLIYPQITSGSLTGLGAAYPAVIKSGYNGTGYDTYIGFSTYIAPTTISDHQSVGSLWGMAYSRQTKKVFASALFRRQAALGPLGIGGIYQIDPTTNTTTQWLDIETLSGVDAGTDTRNGTVNNSLPADPNDPSHDVNAAPLVGKQGIGDIDLSDDGTTLYVVNLFQQTVLAINTSTKALIGSYPITASSVGISNQSDVRPWGLKYYRGKLYVGVITSAQSTQNVADLKGYVLQFDPSNTSAGFNNYFTLDFTYDREQELWHAWNSNSITPRNSGPDLARNPQPILSDIEFDVNGDMILGVADRHGFMFASKNWGLDTTSIVNSDPFGAGDILHVCKISGTYVLEGASGCSYNFTSGFNTGGEFYNDKRQGYPSGNSNIKETTTGGLAIFPGTNQIVTTAYDEYAAYENGISWFNNTTGNRDKAYMVFDKDVLGTLGKSNGLGDIEILSDLAPLEIGNRVWLDSNGDGIQGADENGIAGITVELLDGTSNVIATATTDGDGLYYFSNNATGTSTTNAIYNIAALTFNSNFCIRIPNVQGVSKQVALGTNSLTLANTGSGTNQDFIDNDGVLSGNDAQICFTTGNAGENNHSYDFGFGAAVLPTTACLGNYVWNDLNQDGIQNNGEVGVSGVTVSLLNGSTNAILATLTTDAYGYYQFCGLTPSTYKVQFSLPSNYVFTGQDNPASDATDSDPNVLTGLTTSYTLVAGDSNMTVDAGIYQPLPITATVGDRVWYDADGNGVQDPTEHGVSGITVSLFNCANPLSPVATTVTDATGNYLFENVAPGSYSVGFSLPVGMIFTAQNGAVSTTDNSDANTGTGKTACFTVIGGDNVRYVDAGILPKPNTSMSLGDRVWNDANHDGIQNPNETGVAGVTVTLYDATGTTIIYTTTTDGLGNYGFNGFPAGCYVVGFDLPAGYTRSPQNAGTDSTKNSDANTTTGMTNQICIAAGQNNPTIDAGIYNASNTNSIGDRVWYDINHNGLQDPSEYGYPGVVVTLYNCTSNAIIATTTTNANGNYLFDGLSNGDYYVGFGFVSGYQFTTANADVAGISGSSNSDANPSTGLTACVTVTGGTNITTVDAGIYPGNNRTATSSLGDIVWTDANNNGLQDNGETGVSGVTVNLYNCSDLVTPIATTTTDGLGNYIFTNLLGGNYAVGFSNLPVGYSFTTKGANIEDENNSDANTTTGQTDCIALGLGEDKMTVDAGIVAPTGTVCLGDYVWIDLNNNGTQDANEPAVPGVTVKLYDNNTNTVLQVATTNSEGKYLFCGLTNGSTYSVGFENLPSGFTFTTSTGTLSTPDNSDANSITGRTTTVTLGATNDLTLDAGIYSPTTAVVGNYVWYDEDADGIQDANEAPISGVLVTLYDNTNTAVASAVTDANGKYLFTNVTPGTYTIGFAGYPNTLVPTTKGTNASADDDSNVDPITGKTEAFSVAAGSSNLTLDAGYKANPIAGLGNYVWNDVNANGLQDANEPGISGVVVTLYASDGTTALAVAITDGNGAYSFPNLTAGTYIVGFATPSGMVPTTYNVDAAGINGALNSDASITTGLSQAITLVAGTYNPNIDAGFKVNLPLPAVLTGFGISENNCKVNLHWITASEKNLAYFGIMRKDPQENSFKELARVKANGTSSIVHEYNYVDRNLMNGNYHYQLQMIDEDLRIANSEIESITLNCKNEHSISVYPNPTSDQLNIQINSDIADAYEIKLIDITGRMIETTTASLDHESKTIVLNLNHLANGSYSISITNSIETKVFKIQKAD